MVSFNRVPADSLVPFTFVEFDNSNAAGDRLQAQPYKILVVGQQFTGAGRKDPLKIHRILNEAQAIDYFGPGSMLAQMASGLFENNKQTEAFFIGLEDAAGSVAATGVIDITGPATASGTLSCYLGGKVYNVAVNGRTIPAGSGGNPPAVNPDTATVVAQKLVTAIQADPERIVDAEVDGSTDTKVNLTARHKGLEGNFIDVQFNFYSSETFPAGITATVETVMSGGTTNPDISQIVNILDDTHYNVIAFPYTDKTNLDALEDELEDRFGPTRQLDGHAFAASALKTITELTTAFGDKTGTNGFFANSKQYSILSPLDSPTPPWVWAAATAGVNALYAQIDPARPFQTLRVRGVLAGKTQLRLEERDVLLKNGISTFLTGNGQVSVERLITTMRENSFGALDRSYLDVNTKQTLSYIRFSFRTHFQTKFPRHKLANDGTRFAAGQAVLTPKTAKAEAISLFKRWELAGLVEGAEQFKAGLIVERSPTDPNRLDFLLAPDLMNQLRVNAAQIGFII